MKKIVNLFVLMLVLYQGRVHAHSITVTALPLPALQQGDTVFVQRGLTYYGQIVITVNNITIIAIGKGAKPVVSGLQHPQGWQKLIGGIYSCATTSFNLAAINNAALPMSRQPAIGYNKYGTSSIDTTRQIVYRKKHWVIDRVSPNGKGASTYPVLLNWGYFYQNSPDFLTSGTWAYQNGNIYCTDTTIQTSALKTLLFIQANNVTVNGIDFTGANERAMYIAGNNVSILNSTIKLSGINAVMSWGCTNMQFINDTVLQSQNNAFYIYCNNSVIKNCVIKSIGLAEGMGASGDGSYTGIMLTGNANTITNNVIDSIGYIPVAVYGKRNIITNNRITNFTLTKDDGGGIYLYGGADSSKQYNIIANNFIANGTGNASGTDNATYLPSSGVYFDENANGNKASNNTIVNCAYTGVQLHIGCCDTITRNTVLNCGSGLFVQQDSTNNAHLVRGNYINSNIIYGSGYLVKLASYSNDISKFAVFKDNSFYRTSPGFTVAAYYKENGSYIFSTNISIQ